MGHSNLVFFSPGDVLVNVSFIPKTEVSNQEEVFFSDVEKVREREAEVGVSKCVT